MWGDAVVVNDDLNRPTFKDIREISLRILMSGLVMRSRPSTHTMPTP
jgi:hypothetical protein